MLSYDSKQAIEKVYIKLENGTGTTDQNDLCYFDYLYIEGFDDTLYLDHSIYHVESIPVTGYKKYFVRDIDVEST